MPIKFNKEVSTKLFRYIQTVDIKFNPIDRRTTSARELLRQVQASRFKDANPNLKVSYHVHDRPDAPAVKFVFVDGNEQVFDSQSITAQQMLFHVHLKASEVEAQYEMSGKSLDDE